MIAIYQRVSNIVIIIMPTFDFLHYNSASLGASSRPYTSAYFELLSSGIQSHLRDQTGAGPDATCPPGWGEGWGKGCGARGSG